MGTALAIWPALLAAQDNTTVGNPQLRNFQLPGERTTPPPQPQTVVPTLPATRPPAAPTNRTRTAAPARGPARTPIAPPERAAPRVAKAPARTPRSSEVERPKPTTHGSPAPIAATPAPVPAAQAPVAAPQPVPTPAAPAEKPAPSSFNWLWLALPALLVLAGLAFLVRRRVSAGRQEVVADDGPPLPEPAPELLLDEVATPAPEPVAAEAPRPWLELDIEPDRAASTPSEASLHYDLVITNVGGETARNIRIDARMFNAADEQPIGAFLGGPIHRHSGSPHITLPPGETLRIAAAVQMKSEEVQVIELQGRRIFVPSVAVNLAYDWGQDGGGRSSKSWLVGRKAEKPSDRMGAFRVDLGPRIYRSVGRKDTKRVMV